MSRAQANLLLTLIALIWGSAFVAQNRAMADIGPMLFTGVRFLVGALVVLPLAVLEWRRLGRERRPLVRLDGLHIASLGLLMMLGAVMQQIGIQTTSVTNAGFLTAIYVPLVPVLGWLLLRQVRTGPSGRRRRAAWWAPSCCRARMNCASALATCGWRRRLSRGPCTC